MGGPNAKNVIVIFSYITIWIFVLLINIKIKNRVVLTYFSVFWVITLFLACITIYVNATGTSVAWALPFVILLLGQWYGINYFVGSFLTSSIIIALISVALSATAVISLKRT
jgi:hypothetical protein